LLDVHNREQCYLALAFSFFGFEGESSMQSTVAAVSPEISNRIVILLSDEMLKALDEWRWSNRIASRGEAVRQLVERGLEQEKPKPPEGKRSK
jgi:hypothetical protein